MGEAMEYGHYSFSLCEINSIYFQYLAMLVSQMDDRLMNKSKLTGSW